MSSVILAMTVPTAAPRTPRAGKPRLPKMNTQLKKTLAKQANRDDIKPMFAWPMLRRRVTNNKGKDWNKKQMDNTFRYTAPVSMMPGLFV